MKRPCAATVEVALSRRLLLALVLLFPLSVAAQSAVSRDVTHQVPLYKSSVIPLKQAAKRISVGNPGIADILVLRDEELYVVGKALGTTNVVVWDRSDRVFASFNLEVTHDLESLKTKLHEMFPGEKLKVFSAQERLILSGEVSSLSRLEAVRELAAGFLPDCIRAQSDVAGSSRTGGAPDPSCKKGSVVNLMQVGGASQVMLKITVAEMARTVVKRLDTDLSFLNFGNKMAGGAVSGGASFPDALDADGLARVTQGALAPGGLSPIGPYLDLFSPNTPSISGTGVFLSYLSGQNFIQAVIDISKRNGLAKILSEPTLTTLTGQEAQFVSGGEFPVPVPQGGGSNATTIEFKEFGVGVRFLPLVLDSGKINLTLKVTVSDLSTDNAVALQTAGSTSTFVIPSLTKRSASSTIELANGQTIGIAGLINDNVREFVDKLPGLGDLPLLGALFRSQEFVSGQTELVIFVTPHLARPIAPQDVRLPTDSFVPPQDLEFYLMGRLEGEGPAEPRTRNAAMSGASLPAGSFGHDLGTP